MTTLTATLAVPTNLIARVVAFYRDQTLTAAIGTAITVATVAPLVVFGGSIASALTQSGEASHGIARSAFIVEQTFENPSFDLSTIED